MMTKSTTAPVSWTVVKVITFGIPIILLLTVNNSFAAPANSNEDQGFNPSRQAFRSHESSAPLVDYNVVPVIPESGLPLDTALVAPQQQPSDFGIILNYLLARHSGLNNRARFFADMDNARSELARKRSSQSYSRYCAFNAVSCFGRKK